MRLWFAARDGTIGNLYCQFQCIMFCDELDYDGKLPGNWFNLFICTQEAGESTHILAYMREEGRCCDFLVKAWYYIILHI